LKSTNIQIKVLNFGDDKKYECLLQLLKISQNMATTGLEWNRNKKCNFKTKCRLSKTLFQFAVLHHSHQNFKNIY